MRPVGSFKELERRRRKAVALARRGQSASLIAKELEVDRKSVYRWLKMAAGGQKGLASKPHPGRPRKLTPRQHAELAKLLDRGPQAFGWKGGEWTARRVAALVWQHFKIRHHIEHVRHIIKHRLPRLPKPKRKRKAS
jgi:transposase